MSLTNKIRVFVIEDLDLLREGLKICLERSGVVEVVGMSASLAAAMDMLPGREPDIVLLDIGLRDSNGIDGISSVTSICPRAKVIMFTANDDPSKVLESISAGACGYYFKGSSHECLRLAIESVASGAIWIDPVVRRAVESACVSANKVQSGTSIQSSWALSTREQTVLQLLSRGFSNKEIATDLGITLSTARTHVDRIMQKMNASCRTDAVAKALRAGLAS